MFDVLKELSREWSLCMVSNVARDEAASRADTRGCGEAQFEGWRREDNKREGQHVSGNEKKITTASHSGSGARYVPTKLRLPRRYLSPCKFPFSSEIVVMHD